MRLAFMGSPDFAVPALRALHEAGHQIVAVYCQPPRPAGRGHAVQPCPVQLAATALGLPVRTPERLRKNVAEHAVFAGFGLDAAVVAAYGLILPEAMLAAPRRGCLNIHASLLPRWRGAAPIQAAILAGDAETGITIMQMDAGLDTGDMLLREAIPIGPSDTAATLHDPLASLGARLILRALGAALPLDAPLADARVADAPVADAARADAPLADALPPDAPRADAPLADAPRAEPQPAEGATYAAKLTREDGRLAWTEPAIALERRVRSFDPWPGTFTTLAGKPLKVLGAQLAEGAGPPGTVLDRALTVACGDGALRLTRVQLPGRAAMAAEAFLRGQPVLPGTVLGG